MNGEPPESIRGTAGSPPPGALRGVRPTGLPGAVTGPGGVVLPGGVALPGGPGARLPMGPLGPGGTPMGPTGMGGPRPLAGPGGPGGPGGPPPRVVPPKVAWGYIKRSLRLLGPLRGTVAASILLGVLVTGLVFVVPAVWGPIVAILGQAVGNDGLGSLHDAWGMQSALVTRQDGSTSGPTLTFVGWLAVWAGALVLGHILGFLRAWVDAQLDWRLLTEIRQRVHDHLQSLSLDFFTGARSGALMQRIQMESSGVQKLLTDCLLPPMIDIVVLLLALAYMLSLSWQMTIVSLVLSPLALIALRYIGKKLQATTRRMMMTNRQLGGELEETISGIADIQNFNAQDRRSERFRESSTEAAKGSAMMIVWVQMSSRSTQVFIALSTALVLIVGIAFSESFGLTLNSLIVFVGFVPTMFQPAQRIIDAFTTYNSVIPNVASTYELIDTMPTVRESPDATKLPAVHGNIVFDDVTFGYTDDQKILDGLSFSIREGETIALVGSIGSGKSTVFNLLLRFLDPERGRILLDGTDTRQVTLESLREQVSKLSQFPFFLKDSIRENIRLARRDATDAQIEEACREAHVHDVIVDPLKITKGYDTVVDVQVPSGGQKRLIALARSLLRRPEILLLDEPTENLDADQRVRVAEVIRGYAHDRTCIVISHDMDFIADVADRIIVLNGGKVAEEGTHEELMALGGLYRRLYEAQNADAAPV